VSRLGYFSEERVLRLHFCWHRALPACYPRRVTKEVLWRADPDVRISRIRLVQPTLRYAR